MEEFGSVCFYQEVIDELREKLHRTSCEIEVLRMESSEQTRKHREEVKHLLNLLAISNRQRDEARDHLQNLLHKVTFANTAELSNVDPTPKANSPTTTTTGSNSNTFSQSFGSAASSPEFSNSNNVPDLCQTTGILNEPLVRDWSDQYGRSDLFDALVDDLVEVKNLPQRGQLLQAVMEAGPLLSTLLIAGPLPQWRIPPPLHPMQVPPVPIKRFEVDRSHNHCPDSSAYTAIHKGANLRIASMLDFTTTSPVYDVDRHSTSRKKQRF